MQVSAERGKRKEERMKNTTELQDILFASTIALSKGVLDIKTCNALTQVANKLTNIHKALMKIEDSYDDLDQIIINRIHAAGDRISEALDMVLLRDTSSIAQKNIKAAKTECDSSIRALNQALRF